MASQARALPCLPFMVGAALTGAGAAGLATTVAIVIGLSVARFQERRRYANKHR